MKLMKIGGVLVYFHRLFASLLSSALTHGYLEAFTLRQIHLVVGNSPQIRSSRSASGVWLADKFRTQFSCESIVDDAWNPASVGRRRGRVYVHRAPVAISSPCRRWKRSGKPAPSNRLRSTTDRSRLDLNVNSLQQLVCEKRSLGTSSRHECKSRDRQRVDVNVGRKDEVTTRWNSIDIHKSSPWRNRVHFLCDRIQLCDSPAAKREIGTVSHIFFTYSIWIKCFQDFFFQDRYFFTEIAKFFAKTTLS